jgi:16S rRNA processing protein RimM
VVNPPAERVTLARIVRPRGRKGEVAAEILTDFPQRLRQLREVWLVGPDAPERRARVRACWLSPSRGGQAIFHFEGSDSISDAETLVGLEVQVPLTDRAPLPAGRHYVSDLVGCEVWERGASGEARERLGAVREVAFPGRGTPLLAVDTPAGELLIPLAEEICVLIDPARRRIEVVLPEGLRELNR